MKNYVDKDKLQEYSTKLTAKYKTIFATKSEVGSPLIASTVAEMTDTEKVYVYIGSETGYTSGNWYYYDGSDWVSGGIYNAVAFATDDTLTVPGAAADAKAVGDALANIEIELDDTLTQAGMAADAKAVGDALIEKFSIIGNEMNAKNTGYVSKAIRGYDENNNSVSNISSAPYIPYPYVRDGAVHSIICNISTIGTLSFGYLKESSVVIGNAYTTADHVILYTHTFSATGEQTLVFPVPLVVPEGYVLAIGAKTNTAKFKFGTNGTKGFVTTSSYVYSLNTSYSLGMDINIILQNNGETHVGYTEKTIYAAYDDRNTSNLYFTSLPVIPSMGISGCYVTSIKMKLKEAGRISFGYAIKNSVVIGEAASRIHCTSLYAATIDTTDTTTITFPVPLYIPTNAVFAIGCQQNDNAQLKYGKYGAENGCIIVSSSTGNYSEASNGCGVDIRVLTAAPKSIYAGKKVSIYGDSISTFQGYIPSGNQTYYTGTNAGVPKAADTWWMKTQKALEFDLLVNNSFSGRAVSSCRDSSSTYGPAAAYKEANVLALKSGDVLPDVIIIKLGINDFNHGAYLGTYDGATALPTDPTYFLDAYAIMLNLIMTNYPLAKVFCCTLMQCEKNGTIGFPEINSHGETLSDWNDGIRKLANAFGAVVMDHNSTGITYYNLSSYMGDYDETEQTGLHPNAAGHSLIANKTIEIMDNAVRIRY